MAGMDTRPTRRRVALARVRLAAFAVVGASVALLAELRVDEPRLGEAERIVRDPSVLESPDEDIADDARAAWLLVAMSSAVSETGSG